MRKYSFYKMFLAIVIALFSFDSFAGMGEFRSDHNDKVVLIASEYNNSILSLAVEIEEIIFSTEDINLSASNLNGIYNKEKGSFLKAVDYKYRRQKSLNILYNKYNSYKANLASNFPTVRHIIKKC